MNMKRVLQMKTKLLWKGPWKLVSVRYGRDKAEIGTNV